MGLRGPSKTPSAIVELRGNPGHRAINRLEPRSLVFDLPPEPPVDMDEKSKHHWNDLSMVFTEMRILQQSDLPALQKLAFECARLEELQAALMKSGYLVQNKGTGTIRINPLFKAMMEISKVVDAGLRQFGATPASRPGLIADHHARIDTAEEMVG